MIILKKMREYPLCSENVGRVDALQEIVLKFLGEDAQVERRRIAVSIAFPRSNPNHVADML